MTYDSSKFNLPATVDRGYSGKTLRTMVPLFPDFFHDVRATGGSPADDYYRQAYPKYALVNGTVQSRINPMTVTLAGPAYFGTQGGTDNAVISPAAYMASMVFDVGRIAPGYYMWFPIGCSKQMSLADPMVVGASLTAESDNGRQYYRASLALGTSLQGFSNMGFTTPWDQKIVEDPESSPFLLSFTYLRPGFAGWVVGDFIVTSINRSCGALVPLFPDSGLQFLQYSCEAAAVVSSSTGMPTDQDPADNACWGHSVMMSYRFEGSMLVLTGYSGSDALGDQVQSLIRPLGESWESKVWDVLNIGINGTTITVGARLVQVEQVQQSIAGRPVQMLTVGYEIRGGMTLANFK